MPRHENRLLKGHADKLYGFQQDRYVGPALCLPLAVMWVRDELSRSGLFYNLRFTESKSWNRLGGGAAYLAASHYPMYNSNVTRLQQRDALYGMIGVRRRPLFTNPTVTTWNAINDFSFATTVERTVLALQPQTGLLIDLSIEVRGGSEGHLVAFCKLAHDNVLFFDSNAGCYQVTHYRVCDFFLNWLTAQEQTQHRAFLYLPRDRRPDVWAHCVSL